MSKKIKVNIQYKQCAESDKRFVIHCGGSRSGKTYAIVQYLISFALSHDPEEKAYRITVVRKFLPSLKDSAMQDFLEILTEWGHYDEGNHNKTDLKYKLNGHTFKFLATGDQPERLRSIAHDIVYINEVQELTKEEFRQLNMRTTTQVFMDYNPSMSEHWVYDLEDARGDDTDVFVSTWADNKFLGKVQRDEILALKKTDPEAWKVYGEGKRASMNKGRIFRGWEQVQNLPEEGEIFWGLDFGFFPDPTSLLKIVSLDETIYVKEILHSTKLMDEDIIRALNTGGYYGEPIYCDHNQKQTIEQLRRAGMRATEGRKGSGSKLEGINFLKRASVCVTEGSQNVWKEYNGYSWKLKRGFDPDDEGAYEQVPIDKNDHAMDSLRLAYYSHYFVGNKFWVV